MSMTEVSSDASESGPPLLLDFWREAPDFGDQVPVRFRAAGIELLVSYTQDGSLRSNLPLLVPAFVTLGLACLRLAKQTGRAALELDDYANELLFRVTGDEISICSTMWGRTARLDYEPLFDYWLNFAKDARSVITQRHPEQQSNDYWNLLQDPPNPMLAEYLTRESWFEGRTECFK